MKNRIFFSLLAKISEIYATWEGNADLEKEIGRGYRRAMAKGLRVLRRQYRLSLTACGGARRNRGKAAQASPQRELYHEWLRDNYYLLAREGAAALREMKRGTDLRALAKPLCVCREVCAGAAAPDAEALARALQRARCKSAESALLPLALRLAFVEAAVESTGEGMDPARRAALLSGAVTSLRALQDVDFDSLLEQISPLEKILRQDPAGVYPRMDEASRGLYRHLIQKQARRLGIPEEALARELARKAAGASAPAEKHVGTALLQNAHPKRRGRALLWCESLVPAAFSLLLALFLRAWYLFPLLCLPLTALCRIFLEAIFLRGVRPAALPRLELGGEIPEEGRTLITVSTLLPDPSKAQVLRRRMEELRGTNHGKNIAVCILADLKAANAAETPQDAAALAAAKKQTDEMNQKYGGGFLCAVRRRRYSPTMNAYTGWERKRGALLELAQVIRGKKQADDVFALLCGDLDVLNGTAYLLALDADTQLPLDAVPEMVAAALHPANRPRVDQAMGRVVRGYGILMPHVDLDLASARCSPFARAMAGEGGNTPYSNQVAERYQDLFGCGIFAGKGLIDMETFVRVSELRPFPDEQVLSHDILEGGYLRAGFLSDVHVSDGFPGKQGSFFARQERWVRGDWQNLPFLAQKRGLPAITRYQLFDNLRRSLLAPACLAAILISLLAPAPVSLLLCLAGVLGMAGGYWASAVRCLCSGGLAMLSRAYYSGGLPAALGDFIRGFLQVMTLAQAAYCNLSGCLRGLWRTYFTKKNRLSWTTAAQSEAASGKLAPWLALLPSVLVAALTVILGSAGHRLLGIVILSDLLFAHFSAKQRKNENQRLGPEDTEKIATYCAAMWNYFETYCTAEHHFLPPDNVQEAPVFRVAPRTSPTNIGLYLLCVLAARDLDVLDSSGLELRLGRTLDTLERLERWNGNFLNWYDTRTLRPLEPRYVSTVDSGNFVVSLRTLRMGLAEYIAERPSLAQIVQRLRVMEADCDLKPLYNPRRRLFHIGVDLSDGKASSSYYDLLMSEARMTSYYAVATRAVPKKHWGALGRTLAKQGRFTGPVSWTGTMFEYFMPYVFLPAPRGTLGYEALRFCLYCQKKRVRSQMNRVPSRRMTKASALPWGNSESGFYAFDSDLNYQYKAHGAQKLGLRRGLDEELVLAPYASFLAMQLAPKTALENLRLFEKMELTGSCGFYEAADATALRIGSQDYAVVRSYMAHHVGMSLLAALNTLQDGVWRRRFMADEEMAGGRQLLEEKIPDRAAVFRDIDLRDTPRPRERVLTSKQVFTNVDPAHLKCHLLSNGEWSSVLTDAGPGVSFYRGLSIFRYDADALRRTSGVSIALAEAKQPPVFITPSTCFPIGSRRVEFGAACVSYAGEGAQVTAAVHVRVHPRLPAEERRVTLKNSSRQPAKGSVFFYFEPSLTDMREDAAHPAFAKLFLTDDYDEAAGIVVFTRKQRESSETLCLAAGVSQESGVRGQESGVICERSKERAFRRGMLFGQARLEGGRRGNPDACGAFEAPYHLQPGETREFCLHLCAGITKEEATARLLHLRNAGPGRKNLRQGAPCPFREGELPTALAQRVLPKLLFYAPLSPELSSARAKLKAPRQALWSLGVSGDEPYIYLPVASPEDIPAALPYLSLFRRLRSAGIPCELVIGYNEGGDYDTPMMAALQDALRREHCAHLENRRGGVRMVNLRRAEDRPEALEALLAYASASRESGDRNQESGDAKPLLPILPTNPVKCVPAEQETRIVCQESGIRNQESGGAGAFYPGRFIISKHNPLTPDSCPLIPNRPWSLPLCNPAFGTLLSDSSLGYTWAVNARENKLTPWFNESCRDNRGELLLLKFGGQLYDLCLGGRCEFRPEAALWQGEIHGLEYELKVYVPERGLTKRAELLLRNRTTHPLTPDLAYYLEPVLGVRREPHLPIQGEALPDGFLFTSPASQIKGYGALLLQGGADFVCADRPAFLRGDWYGGAALGSDPCVAAGRRLQIPAGGETTAEFALNWGAVRNAALCAHLVASPEPERAAHAPFRTPDPALDEMLNVWLPHQVLHSRLYGRTGHCQCGGAWGLRDQLQDVSALYHTHPAIAKAQIARCAAAQFIEGDGLHWWHRIPGVQGLRGVRTRYADDYLWLPFIASEYIHATNDLAFLDTQIPFIEGEPLRPDEKDRCAVYPQSKQRASLYAHCLLAVERGLRLLGSHGLPLMQGGDWNDGMNEVGAGGRGESVWLGMFLVMVLEGMAGLCEIKNETAPAERFRYEANQMRSKIDEHAWAGNHYLRAFWDDGTPMGGHMGVPMDVLDLLPQAFSALCAMPNQERVNLALDTAIQRLVDEEHNLIHLLEPPFSADGPRAGYINDYPPGIRENGGQYTHAAVWLCLALGRAGRAAEARRLLQLINPAQFCQDPARMARYGAEPYALAGDVSAAPGIEGRAGWVHYTGSAAWFLRCAAEVFNSECGMRNA